MRYDNLEQGYCYFNCNYLLNFLFALFAVRVGCVRYNYYRRYIVFLDQHNHNLKFSYPKKHS